MSEIRDVVPFLQGVAALMTMLFFIIPLFRGPRGWLKKKVGGLFTAEIELEQIKTNRALTRIGRTMRSNHKEGMELIRALTHDFEEHETDRTIHGNGRFKEGSP